MSEFHNARIVQLEPIDAGERGLYAVLFEDEAGTTQSLGLFVTPAEAEAALAAAREPQPPAAAAAAEPPTQELPIVPLEETDAG